MVLNRVKGIFRKRPADAPPSPPPPPDVTIIQSDDFRMPGRALDSLNRWLSLVVNVAILIALIVLIFELRKPFATTEGSLQPPAATDSAPE
ncbi:hypothetical protein [Hyphomonas pacifica]|uniref:Uncharacterized protein n=1 Tax=Hyphomonas pacifica TaxID=1280941 RepID=A0A062U992_9PROT|nr:hypothetical protein [Hyphomonas pacifica]KCZ52695.1 hypothetical protein HY2_08105 [Hyphomonas pacifica]RAN34059.1 hypothetical protein HY3_11570 [Hyphomonas pacifica]